MEIAEVLRQMNEMWGGNDIPCDFGCSPSQIEEMALEAKRLYPDKPYCSIENWVWTDLNVTDELKEQFTAKGVLPCFVRTQNIICDEARRPHLSNSVRSTALVAFHSNSIFVTANTSYLLVGPGSRVMIDPEVLQYLPHW